MDTRTARRCARSLEPLHAMIYFAPEAEEELTAVGVEKGRMSYFAGRAAPMGAVTGGVVVATFYNFNPELVARHLPRAWSLADPATVVAARFRAVDRALRRLLGDDVVTSPEVQEAGELARRAAAGCTPEGRPLYAAHADLEWPEEPHLVLWHALSLLREHRGDGHVAALVAAEFTGLQALITHTATGKGFVPAFAMATRGWSEQQWAEGVSLLHDRGMLDSEGHLTEDGEQMRMQIDDETNTLGVVPWESLGDAGVARLAEVGGGLAKRIVAAGCFPEGIFGR